MFHVITTFLTKLILLFSKDTLHCLKVTEIFIMLHKISIFNKYMMFF